jgi:alkanesulfonate monooxygenase SsuD/methylene tetrahydromethanopterin reductase-like flavin-dependent oxidoreductase (luciferase family)
VQILRQMWTDGRASLDGTHYRVDEAICRPLPLQHGGPPLWVAGGGEKKTLRIAARHARYTNFDGSLEGFRRKSKVLAGHCRDLGTDFDAITRSANYNVVIGRTEAEVEDRIAAIRDRYSAHVDGAKLEQAVNAFRTGPLVGTPERIVDTLSRLRDAGLAYAITYFSEAAYDTSGMQLFADEVVPALR